jgi:hypothetical protein
MPAVTDALRNVVGSDTGGGAFVGARRQGRQPQVVDQLRRLQEWRRDNELANAQHSIDLQSMPVPGKEPTYGQRVAMQRAGEHVAEGMNVGGITTWHGTPHVFSKFDPSKVGTGEGAQVYGHGLYLAENRSVAQKYAEDLSRDRPRVEGGGFADTSNPEHVAASFLNHYKDRAVAAQELQSNIDMPGLFTKEDLATYRKAHDLIRSEKSLPSIWDSTPQLYKVDLPDQHLGSMLDWDNPLYKQPELMKKLAAGSNLPENVALRKTLDALGDVNPTGARFPPEGSDFLRQYAQKGGDPNDMWAHNKQGIRAAELSENLQRSGVPGVKYWDQESRYGRGDTSNFVVFPQYQDTLSILERNGVPIQGYLDALRSK